MLLLLRLLLLLLSVTTAAGQQQTASPSPACPCVAELPNDIDTRGTNDAGEAVRLVQLGEDTYRYPIEYGLNTCGAYDEDRQPFCVDDHGQPRADAPAWCGSPWCYVDSTNCNIAMGALRSTYFEGASYSYQTCEPASGGTASGSIPSVTTTAGVDLTVIASTIENYLRADARAVEIAHHSTISSMSCDSRTFCPCSTCEHHEAWQCAGDGGVDLAVGGLFLNENADHSAPEVKRMKCMTSAVNSNFLRTVGTESEGNRIGYQYFGDQGSAGLAQWPSVNWCSDTYDPRFRPWYTGSASGPKDVVIVIDTSYSMSAFNRIELAKQATVKVLDTLTWHDHAAIVLFDDVAVANAEYLQAMTAEAIENLKTYAETNIRAEGGTRFDAAFDKAFAILRGDGPTSACNKIILFMTDGESLANLPAIRSQAASLGTRIFTYALGSGADVFLPKQIACENGGVFHAVEDGSNLGDVMASYYKLFAAGMPKRDRCKVRWNDYVDVISGVELLTATMPVYKVEPGQSMCNDDGADNDGADNDESLAELLGVVAVDMNVITELEPMFNDPAWDSFWSGIISDSCSCPGISLSHNQLEALRATTDGSQQCGTLALLSIENSNNPPPAPDHTTSTCGVGVQPARGASNCSSEVSSRDILVEDSLGAWLAYRYSIGLTGGLIGCVACLCGIAICWYRKRSGAKAGRTVSIPQPQVQWATETREVASFSASPESTEHPPTPTTFAEQPTMQASAPPAHLVIVDAEEVDHKSQP